MADRRREVTVRVASLLEALQRPGDNSELIALRARALLPWAPQQASNIYDWLRGELPTQRDFNRTMAALRPANGRAKANAQASSPSPQPSGSRRRVVRRHGRH